MSTKIYYGFMIQTTKLEDILEIVRDYRKTHWEQDAKAVKKNFKQNILDAVANGNLKVKEGDTPKWTAEKLWMDLRKEMKDKGTRNRLVDTDFQIVIFPDKERFLGIAYVDHDKWFQQFLKMPGVQEYGYWNNTDPIEGVTDEEWDQRGKEWDRILCEQGGGIPSMEGFTIDISDPYGPWKIEEVLE